MQNAINRQDSIIIDLYQDKKKKKKASSYQITKNKLELGSWCEENKSLFKIFLLTSYFAAAVSLSSAFFYCYDAAFTFSNNYILSSLIGAIALLILELFDRISSKKLWYSWFFFKEINWGWAIAALGIFATSLFLSVDGEQAAKETARASPKLVATNTLLEEKKAEKAEIEKTYDEVKANPRSYKDHKTMLVMWWPTQKSQDQRIKDISNLRKEIYEIEQELKGKNHLLATDHIQKVEKIGNVFLGVVVVFALFYQFCIAFIVYFNRQEYNEEKLKEELISMHEQGVKITPILAAKIQAEIRKPLKRKRRLVLDF